MKSAHSSRLTRTSWYSGADGDSLERDGDIEKAVEAVATIF